MRRPRAGVLLGPALAAALLAGPVSGPLHAQAEDKICALCHADVRPEDSQPRAHVDLSCTECHVDLLAWDPAEEDEHPEHLAGVDCRICHADQARALAGSVHAAGGAGAPRCTDCHGNAHFQPLLEGRAPLARKRAASERCAACHEPDLARFSDSAHRAGLAAGDAGAPSCADCHGAHEVRPPAREDPSRRCEGCHEGARAGMHHAPGAAPAELSCLACHDGHDTGAEALRAKTFSASGGNKCALCHAGRHAGSLPAQADCTGCHGFHWPVDAEGVSAPAPPAAEGCVECHADAGAIVLDSAHAGARTSCSGCHLEAPAGVESACPERVLRAVDCGRCHTEAFSVWEASPHGGDPGNGHPASLCTDCHGAHDARASDDPRSRVWPLNLPDTCEACHKVDPSPEHPAPSGAKVAEYDTGAHGRALRKDGLIVSATCASCHGSHDIRRPGDPAAPTSRANVPRTCGACHAGILDGYLEGAHGAQFLSGSTDVPVCTDCHREHGVAAPDSAASSVSPRLVAETCARCHGDEEFARSKGLKIGVRASWGSSYHGIASAFGAEGVANCASCHGYHEVFPSDDPRSKVNAANLDRTCGACHPNASEAFARVPVHSTLDPETNPVPYWVKRIYTVLLALVIGSFVLFILFDLFGRLRLRLGWGPSETEHVKEEEWPDEDLLVLPREKFVRMGRPGRIQHAILVSSFLLLVLTGVPVFLHDFGIMRSLIDLEGGFALRSKLHRVGAVGLIGLSVWHLGTIALSGGARRWVKAMLFRPRDVLDFAQEMLFDLGIGPALAKLPLLRRLVARWPALAGAERPLVGRYGLVEKLEYGAVVWGNLVMIATGAILWRPDWFLDWTPKWTFDVCRVVHGYEATLAFLAIIIWHMYHVHLRPGVFPMSRVWLDGKISREELRHHHPGEYLEILRRRRAARSDG